MYETTTQAFREARHLASRHGGAYHVMQGPRGLYLMGEQTKLACLKAGLLTHGEFVRDHVATFTRTRDIMKGEAA